MDVSAPIYSLVLAPFVGSFAGLVGRRSNAPGSIVWGRSACQSCRHVLGAGDLVPVLSWLALRGRCRYCGISIGAADLGVELAALGIALWSSMLMSGWWLWMSCLLGWMLLALAVSDLRHQLLPDFLTLPLLVIGLASAAVLAPDELPSRLLGAVIGFIALALLREAYWILRAREGIGLGDAKLLAAAGAWIGWQELAGAILVAALGALAVVGIRYCRGTRVSLGDRLPFGAYLCLGIWVEWLYGPLGGT